MNNRAISDIRRKLKVLRHARKPAISRLPAAILGFLERLFVDGNGAMNSMASTH